MCGLQRELCCCRSSRRISDSYFLLEMLGSAASQTIRVKQSRFFPLLAHFGCWGGLVFTLSLPAFSGWRLCVRKVHQCCSRIVLAMLSRYWAEDDRLCHIPSLPTQKCILALSLIKSHIKYAMQQGLEVFGHQVSPGDWSLPCLVQALSMSPGWEGSRGSSPGGAHLGASVSLDWLMTLPCSHDFHEETSSSPPCWFVLDKVR